eukprot:Skav210522  [mRNA]  locus=scaffold3045:170575:172536:+ [translate_table: standard]
MARLSQQALSDAYQAIAQAGASPGRDPEVLEEALLATRNRVRQAGPSDTLEGQRRALSRCLGPLQAWVENEPDLRGMPPDVRSDLLWNLYTSCVSRTQGAEAFPLITQDPDVWFEMVTLMEPVAPPAHGTQLPHATHGGDLHLKVLFVGMMLMAIDPWMPSGRWRFYSTSCGTFLLGLGAFLWYMGWTSSPWGGRHFHAHGEVPVTGPRRADVHVPDHNMTQNMHNMSQRPPAEPAALPGPPQVPPGVPAVPSAAQQLGLEPTSSGAPARAAGERIRLGGVPPFESLAGQTGVVVASHEGRCEVRLDNGLVLKDVSNLALVDEAEAVATPQPTSSTTYAPYASRGLPTKLQNQASRLKDALTKAAAISSTTPTWGALFWQAVKNEKDLYSLEPEIGNILQSHGYVGEPTRGPPRTEELKKQLTEIETLGGPAHGTGGTFARVADINEGANPEEMSWHLKLPADLQRAAPELYRNIHADGAHSCRAWVNDQHPTPELKQSPAYQDLFTAATIIDFELADCKSESAIMHRLAISDTLEIHLRKLGSFVYYKRTKDRTGANRMLGVRAPGSGSDIAPKWLLDDANAHSKLEWQRAERGQKMNRAEQGQRGSGGRAYGGGKFRGRGGGGGKGGGRGSSGAMPHRRPKGDGVPPRWRI